MTAIYNITRLRIYRFKKGADADPYIEYLVGDTLEGKKIKKIQEIWVGASVDNTTVFKITLSNGDYLQVKGFPSVAYCEKQ